MIRSKVQENPDKLLTHFGVFLGLLAVVYFGREAIFNLTPLVKSLLLVLASAFFLGGSKITEERSSIAILYFFSTVSYLTFLGYYTLRMKPSTNTVFLLLGISGLLFIVIGKKIGEYELHRENAKKTALVLLLISIALIAVDLNAPDVSYTTSFEETIQIGQEDVSVGSVTVENSYILPQTYSVDRVETCSSGDTRIAVTPKDHSKTSGIIDGQSEKTIEYIVRERIREEGESNVETYSLVSTDSCPEQKEENNIYIYQVSDR